MRPFVLPITRGQIEFGIDTSIVTKKNNPLGPIQQVVYMPIY